MVDIAILDFKGQYVLNIKRVLLEIGINAGTFPFDVKAEKLKREKVKGIILSGGPYSAYDKSSPKIDKNILEIGVPILGICYGHQLLAKMIGGKVKRAKKGEYGFSILKILKRDIIFEGLNNEEICWMSHGDEVIVLPEKAEILASTENCKVAAFKFKNFYGIQFHPEVSHTPKGHIILRNFALKICKCKTKKINIKEFLDKKIKEIKNIAKGKCVICAVSGGIDSTVAACLAYKALGDKAICVHVNTGFMRKNESEKVVKNLRKIGLKVLYINAKKIFMKNIKNVKDPDLKRKIIGETFIRIFEKIAKKYDTDIFVQGTIAPDIIESTRGSIGKGMIKVHHNVGGLPEKMKLKKVEPLKELFKYQVRELARYMNLPKYFIERQPFPGPGLACRIVDDVTPEKLEIVRESNYIVEKYLRKHRASQYFAYLFNNKFKRFQDAERFVKEKFGINVLAFKFFDNTIGVKGDKRYIGKMLGIKIENGLEDIKYIELLKIQSSLTSKFDDIIRVLLLIHEGEGKYNIAIRSVETLDFMTAIPSKIDIKDLQSVSKRIKKISNKIANIFYDITTKPPATIEVI